MSETMLTNSEWYVLDCLWERAPQTVTQLVPVLKEKVGWAKSTTITTLRRMEEKGLVTAYEREAAAGKPRRYYHLTREGQAALREKEAAWHTYAAAVGRVLEGGACCAGT